AVPIYREIIRIDPDNRLVYFNLGVALTALGKTEEAIQAFQQAVLKDPSDQEARRLLQQLQSQSLSK
ncbi:MAG: tetratricopeptide repeat protein, partial [bacterium]|nr:tetratricopeptide repeat protein [bacterium]